MKSRRGAGTIGPTTFALSSPQLDTQKHRCPSGDRAPCADIASELPFRRPNSRKGGTQVLEIKNYTDGLERGEAFLRAKLTLINTHQLSIHIKHTYARGCDLTGYYRWHDRRLVAAVRPGLRYPVKAAYSVAQAPRKDGRSGFGRQKIWYEDRFHSADDLFVFVAGHEVWHFLCDSRQRPVSRDQETLANCLGFLWLREFKRWKPGARVAPIPHEPPRPDLLRASARAGYTDRRRGRTTRARSRRTGTQSTSRTGRQASAAATRRSTRAARRQK
jgi:hypothetical protein